MLDWLRRRRRERALRRRAIPDALWERTLARYPFLTWRDEADLARLRELTTLFLDAKEFTGAGGFELDDAMAVTIAAQACLPVLELGLACYDNFVGIVVHADAVVAQREVVDDDGIVHAYEEELSGEAMPGGPVMLSWSDVRDATHGAELAYNVVIHEFAHVLDMHDGRADGVPQMPDRPTRERWERVLNDQYDDFCATLEDGADGVLDPYAAHSVEEFFAVASEAFFVSPHQLADELPQLYALLRGLYRQDPAQRAPR
jgi:Mlc titration factor MtfA (ptsG expression regulator)